MTETPATTPDPSSDGLTDDDRGTIRAAALLAGALVARAERGFFDAIRESMAGSKSLAAAPEEIRMLIVGGGMPSVPKVSTPEELESASLALMGQAVSILRAKAPNLADGYRAAVVQSCREVAAAADDTSANEAAVIANVEAALA